jgi:hypothetical protein
MRERLRGSREQPIGLMTRGGSVRANVEHQLSACVRCGYAATAITVHNDPHISIARCWKCERRAWSVDGADATIADVLAVLRRPGRSVA